jgi:hypothetical protein
MCYIWTRVHELERAMMSVPDERPSRELGFGVLEALSDFKRKQASGSATETTAAAMKKSGDQ